MNIWPGIHFIPLSSTSAEYDGVWFSAGSAPLTPVLFVCIFLVILAPVSSSAHYLLQLFPRSDFFLLSNECVLKCSEVQYFPQNILKSKITDLKNYLKKYKYTKKLLNYSNASKCNSLLSTSGNQQY